MPDEQHDYYKFPRPTPYQPGQFNAQAQSAQPQPQPQQQPQPQFQHQQVPQTQYTAQPQPQNQGYQPAYVQPQQFQQPQPPHQVHVQPNQHYYNQQPAQARYQPYSQPQPQQQTQTQAQTVPTNNNGMFQRRIGRLGFLLGFVYILLAFIGPAMLQFFASSSSLGDSALGTLVNVLCIPLGMAGVFLVVPVVISLYIRRLHDLNHPGIMWLFMLVPLANFFFFLYLCLASGTKGVNNYGMPVMSKNFFVVLGPKKPASAYGQAPTYPTY